MTQPNQRTSNRSSLDSPVEVVDIESGIGFRASGLDVSEGGLAFHAPMEPALGADMYVKFGAGTVPSEFKVLRIEPRNNGFTVAGISRQRAAR
jgi:hypothetical protein